MSTLTIEMEDEAKAVVERVASERNLSPSDFVNIAIAQSLARLVKDPSFGSACRAGGWQRFPRLPGQCARRSTASR